jgi:GT2 family glycosyltransferase
LVEPSDVDFLGFQRRRYADGEPLNTVVINATVWPRRLFELVRFDQRLRYGSDEVDISYAARAAGARIVICRDAINEHHPSEINRIGYVDEAHVSRLLATLKRYWRYQQRPFATAMFIVLAPMHLVAASIRQAGPRGAVQGLRILWIAFRRA